MIFFLAGHETSAHTLCWIFYSLSQNPDILMKVRQEADLVFSNQEIDYELLNELKYTDAVIKEALRIHPTGAIFARRMKNSVEILGHKIPAGVCFFFIS